MKLKKALGLLAGACVAILALAASATGTTISTTTGGAAATPSIHAVNEGGHFTISNPIANISCGFTFEMKIESHGETAKGNIGKLDWLGCTNSWHVTTVNPGSLEIHWVGFAHSGTVTSNGMRFDATRFGVTCIYETNNTHFGLITGGSPATLDLEADLLVDGGLLCGTGTHFGEGNGVTTSALYVNN